MDSESALGSILGTRSAGSKPKRALAGEEPVVDVADATGSRTRIWESQSGDLCGGAATMQKAFKCSFS